MTESSQSAADSSFLLLVRQWQEELREIDEQRLVIVQKLKAAEPLLALLGGAAPSIAAAPAKVVQTHSPQLTLLEPTYQAPAVDDNASWVEAIRTWITAAHSGISYPELRAVIDASPAFSKRFNLSDKGYYNALSRLVGRNELVRHNGRLFSPNAFESYRKAVALGHIEDAPPPISGAYSPMGEAILDIVYRCSNTGVLGKDILQELRNDPEFNAALTPHSTGGYNIIARLVKRHQILRREDGLCFPGNKFPRRDLTSKWLTRGAVGNSHHREEMAS
jgi:hypothetical protein